MHKAQRSFRHHYACEHVSKQLRGWSRVGAHVGVNAKVSYVFTQYWCDCTSAAATGLPAVALPFSLDTSQCASGLPIGVQLIGRSFGEAELLHLAHTLEQTIGFSEKHKPPAVTQ